MAAPSKRVRYEVLRRDNFACRYCGRTPPEVKLQVDAVVPGALGGTHKDPANLVAACADCNSGKTSTSPDSPLVADVAQDAFRWSQAMAVAATEMLAKASEHMDAQEHFLKSWKRFGSANSGARRKPLPMDANWRHTVDQMLSSGLPLSELEDCIDIAMSRRNLAEENVFRYMCGVAWNKVTEMQKRAQQILGQAAPPEPGGDCDDAGPADIDAWCREILAQRDDQQDVTEARGDSAGRTESENPSSVLWFLINNIEAERNSLAEVLRELLLALPSEIGAREIARHEGAYRNEYQRLISVTQWATEHMLLARARQEMAALPRGEYEAWVQASRHENADFAEHLSESFYVLDGARMAREAHAGGEG